MVARIPARVNSPLTPASRLLMIRLTQTTDLKISMRAQTAEDAIRRATTDFNAGRHVQARRICEDATYAGPPNRDSIIFSPPFSL
jgi:hypothetical protein